MNWVLIIILTAYPPTSQSGVTSQQIGPYASSADCEKAFTVVVEQDGIGSAQRVREHFCVPHAYNSSGADRARDLPKEFD